MFETETDYRSMAPYGILLLCTGMRGDLLRNCLRSLQATNPSLPFHLLADRPYDAPFQWVDSWIGKASRRIKTQLHKYSPYEISLFVDDDTIFAKAIDIAGMLGDGDLAVAVDVFCPTIKSAETKGKAAEVEETISLCGEAFPFYNSGVLVWRKNSVIVRHFFDEWHKEWIIEFCIID